MKSDALFMVPAYQAVSFSGLEAVIRAELPPDRPVSLVGVIAEANAPAEILLAEASSSRGEWLVLALPTGVPEQKWWQGLAGKNYGWLMAWADVLRRAGYLPTRPDHEHLARLLSFREHVGARVEVAVDTSAVLSGGVHYLCRLLGDRLDFVRVDAVHREITKFKRNGNQYLAGNRALEVLPHAHPKWRKLDVDDAALLLARSSDGEKKSGDVDLLILRVVAKWIRDSVPGIWRVFATADSDLSRQALHELPPNCLIHFSKSEVSPTEVCSSLLWIPGPDQGRGSSSGLAWLVWEALSICDEVRLTHAGASLSVRAYLPGLAGTPSFWTDGTLWWKKAPSSPLPIPESVEDVDPADGGVSDAGGNTTEGSDSPVRSVRQRRGRKSSRSREGDALGRLPLESRRPRANEQKTAAGFRGHRPFMKLICNWLVRVREMVRHEQRDFDTASDRLSNQTVNHHVAIFVAAGLLVPRDAGLVLGPRAVDAAEAVDRNDTDYISDMFESHVSYGILRRALRDQHRIDVASIRTLLGSAAGNWSVVARQFGQAVEGVDGQLWDGGQHVEPMAFRLWVQATVRELADRDPLRQASMVDIARRALGELRVSPYRLERMLVAAEAAGSLGEVRGVRGGTPDQVLAERVVAFESDGWRLRDVSADRLGGWRALTVEAGT